MEIENEKELTHIDLFSGIGGFTLAGEWAGFKTTIFCEKEIFCQKVLKKHWPAIPIVKEIRDFDGKEWRGSTLLTGGFPCQPFSVAGKQKGKKDDRYLWPEMLRVISEAKPHWILAENVPGIFQVALDTVLSDLEGKGYSTGTFIIPACSLNAPHRRNRIWIIAYARKSERNWISDIGKQKMAEVRRKNQNAPNSPSKREKSISQQGQRGGIESANSNSSNSTEPRLEGAFKSVKQGDRGRFTSQDRRQNWQEDWYEVATQFCRVDDGVSDRVHRLKALGNAIVPQVAYEILKNIAWIEREIFS